MVTKPRKSLCHCRSFCTAAVATRASLYLHRILWDHKIPHEYHLVRGADHVGRTIRPRANEGLEFLARLLNPPPPDPEVEAARKRLEPLKKAAERKP
jgi:hypothetical protein